MVNFEGQLVPVEDAGGLLDAREDAAGPVIVVICRDGERHVGIAVCHVLDVAAGGTLFEAGTSQHTAGVTLLKDRVTGVVELAAVAPLGAVAPRAAQSRKCATHGRRQSDEHSKIGAAGDGSRRRKKMAATQTEVCSVRLGEGLFGIPITHILEIVGGARPQPVPQAPGFVGGLVHYRGDVLTTVSLRHLLDLPASEGAAGHAGGGERGRMLRGAGRFGGRSPHRVLGGF